MPQGLAQLVKSRANGAYDQVTDADLEKAVLSKPPKELAALIRQLAPGAYDSQSDDAIASAMQKQYGMASAPATKSTTDKAWDWAKHAVSSVNETFHPLDMIKGAAQTVADVGAAYVNPQKGAELGSKVFHGVEGESERLNQLLMYGPSANNPNRRPTELVPFVGPQIVKAADKIASGDITGGVGNAIGIGLNVEGPRLAAAAIMKAPAVAAAAQAHAAARAAGRGLQMDMRFSNDLMRALDTKPIDGLNTEKLSRTKPYLVTQNATAPISDIETLYNGAHEGVKQISGVVSDYIDANPNAMLPNQPFRQAWSKLRKGARSTDVDIGMEDLRSLDLEQPMTLKTALEKLERLNAENKGVLDNSRSTVHNIETTDPKYMARATAADALREGIFDELERLGMPGVRDLRLDQGALIKLRDAAYAKQKLRMAEAAVPNTGKTSAVRRMAADAVRYGSMGVGGGVGFAAGEMIDPLTGKMGLGAGAIVGKEIGSRLANQINVPNLSRNALVQRAFKNLRGPEATFNPPVTAPPSAPSGAGPRGPFGGGGGPSGGPQGSYGPRPTVTIVPPGQIGPPGPPGLPPAPGGAGSAAPLQLGPRGQLALGPRTSREMGTGKPDYRAPRIPTVPLPTTWNQLDEFTGKAPDKATGQDPALIGEALTEGNDAGSRPGVGRPTYVEIPKWDDTPAGKREKAAQQRKFEAKAKAAEANGTALDFEGETDFAFGDNVPAGKTADKRVSIPAAYQSHFDTLVADARAQGAKETQAQLASAYRHHLNGAVEAVKEFYGAEADTSWRTLLKGISAAGGIGVDADAGMAGEVSHLMEDMGKEMKGKRSYTKGGKEFTRTAPVTSRGVKGIPGIVKGKGMGGYPLDTIREALEESGDFPPGKYDNLADLLEDIKSALRMAQNPDAALNAVVTPDRVQMAMDRVQDVRPGSKWWGK